MGTQSHISKIATHLIGKLKISWEDANPPTDQKLHVSPLKLYKRRADDVRRELKRMSPETLGKIAVQGEGVDQIAPEEKTPLYFVHGGSYLWKYWSGREILLELATTAVIAEMTDQLELQWQVDAGREFMRLLDEAIAEEDLLNEVPDSATHIHKRTHPEK